MVGREKVQGVLIIHWYNQWGEDSENGIKR